MCSTWGGPSSRNKGGIRLCFPLLLLSLFPLHASAQNASTSAAPTTNVTLGQSIVALNGPWKFHIGDNPQWADPKFDDSQWENVDLTPKPGSFDPSSGLSGYVPGWTAKGHPGYWGYAWYRIRVRVVAQTGEKLTVAGPPDMDDAYQVFANGRLLGSFGKFRGLHKWPTLYGSRPRMFPLPQPEAGDSASTVPATQVLAFRVWMEPNTLKYEPDPGGLKSAPLLGETGVVAAQYKLVWLEIVRSYGSGVVEGVLFLLLAILACSVAMLDRSDTVYPWLAGVFLLTAIYLANGLVARWTLLESGVAESLADDAVCYPLMLGGWAMVWWVWFRLRSPAWMPRAIAGLTLLYMLAAALGEDVFYTAIPHPVGVALQIASLGIRLLFLLLLVLIVIRGIRQQGREAGLALPAVVLVGIAQFENELNVLHIRVTWFPFGTRLDIQDLAYLALVVSIFFLMLRRLLLSLRRQRELALDIKQAQEVQQVLLPMELPHIPGLAIESEYRPAREVGGDFFQIIPHTTDGSALIVVGDVTGKGLQAGMLVALIVGAIRSTAETTADPLSMIEALNRRLCGRGHAHATGLALRIETDGAVTLANAGHLPPYLNGKEIAMEGALPLGMIEGAEFSVMCFRLNEGDRLLLLSDGIAEAQNERAELFGFDRIYDLLQRPITAAEIATSAQNFGQQDDISVMAVTRLAMTEIAVA